MSAKNRLTGPYAATRIILVTAAVSFLAGCSDATRFSDPFASPYQKTSRNGVDRNPTGAISPAKSVNQRIDGQPLAPPSSPPPFMAQNGGPQPVAPKPLSPVPTALGHWTSDGGTAITVGEGESAGMLANRYGVPTEALVKTNGYSSADQIQSGARIVVPVYRASAVGSGLSSTPLAPVHSAPKKAAEKSAEPSQKAFANKAKLLKKTAKHDEADKEAKAAELAKAKAAAAKAKAAQEDDEDEAPAAAPKKTPKQAAVREEKIKQAKAEKPAKLNEKPVKQQAAKEASAQPEKTRTASVDQSTEQPARAESKQAAKAAVDQTPTASLPSADDRAAESSGNPGFRWPVHGRTIQSFKNGSNDGINIAVPEGTSVKAAEGGVVAYAGSELKGYGNLVLIKHPNGYVTAYAHNSELNVKKGEQVRRGQTIAKAGQTGNVDTPQLHFELRQGKTPVDPTSYLAGM